MMIAFDYGATLRVSDGLESLRQLVHELNKQHVPVCVISAVSLPIGRWEEEIKQEILALTSKTGVPLVFESIHFVHYPKNPTESDMFAAGIDKARVMLNVGADIIFDDSEFVCEGVRHIGLHAIRHFPQPSK